MGLHFSKDEIPRLTNKNEVRGPIRKMSLSTQRRPSVRIAKHGLVNASSYSRGAGSKAHGIKTGKVVDDDTVSTRGSRILLTEVADKGCSQTSFFSLFKRHPFACDHGPRLSRSSFRQDSSARHDPSSSSNTYRVSEGIVGDEALSNPLPIPTSTGATSLSMPAVGDEDHEVDHLRRVYDMRTWDMYIRITESRRHSNYQIQDPANSYTCGSSMTVDSHWDPNAGCHSSSDYDEELMFHLE